MPREAGASTRRRPCLLRACVSALLPLRVSLPAQPEYLASRGPLPGRRRPSSRFFGFSVNERARCSTMSGTIPGSPASTPVRARSGIPTWRGNRVLEELQRRRVARWRVLCGGSVPKPRGPTTSPLTSSLSRVPTPARFQASAAWMRTVWRRPRRARNRPLLASKGVSRVARPSLRAQRAEGPASTSGHAVRAAPSQRARHQSRHSADCARSRRYLESLLAQVLKVEQGSERTSSVPATTVQRKPPRVRPSPQSRVNRACVGWLQLLRPAG